MLPIQIDPNHQGNSFADTTPQQAQLNARYAYGVEVDKRNAAKVADFEVQWAKYKQSRDERPDVTNIPVPTPAFAEIWTADANGWPYITPSMFYVTPPRTYTPVTRSSTVGLRGDAPVNLLNVPDVKVGEIFALLERRYVRIA